MSIEELEGMEELGAALDTCLKDIEVLEGKDLLSNKEVRFVVMYKDSRGHSNDRAIFLDFETFDLVVRKRLINSLKGRKAALRKRIAEELNRTK